MVTDQHPHEEGVVRPQSGQSTAYWASRSKTGSQPADNVSRHSLQLNFSGLLQKARIKVNTIDKMVLAEYRQ
jgi:hypothetical protein